MTTVTVYLRETMAMPMDSFDPTATYRQAIRYEATGQPGAEGTDLLEHAFREFNIGETSDIAIQYRADNNRSLSVGDIVTLDDQAWYCAALGWDRVLSFTPPTN